MLITDLVIPALDEAPNIGPLFDGLDEVRRLAPSRGFELRRIVLGDNGSTDGTPAVAAERGAEVAREPRLGYGAVCLAALDAIRRREPAPDVIAFIDADLADDPLSLLEVVPALVSGPADLAIGSRVRRAEPGALNAVQRFGNRLACALMRGFAGRSYHDLGPLRAVRWAALERMAMADRTWGWTVEMQMKAALLGLPAVEVDVPYRRRGAGRSKISGTVRGVVKAGTKIIFTIVALWVRRGRIRAGDG